MDWCRQCNNVRLDHGEVCDECGHTQGAPLRQERIAELEADVAALMCKIGDVARRIRQVADMVGDDEMPGELHALARELEDLRGRS